MFTEACSSDYRRSLIFSLLFIPLSIHSDILRLKDGRTIENVTVTPRRETLIARYPDGRSEEIDKSKVVLWQRTPLVDKAGQWITSSGPEGCDATAFYVAENGDYWLGTGSSGGVFKSSDQGETWVEKNQGIGPVHVSWIDRISGELIIQVQDYWDHAKPRYFSFNDGKQAWQSASQSLISNLEKKIEKQTPSSDAMMLGYKVGNYDFTSVWIDDDGYGTTDSSARGYALHHFGQKLTGVTVGSKESLSLSQTFPGDSFQLPAGNLYTGFQGLPIFLTRSCLYSIRNERFRRMSSRGVTATDVRQTLTTPDGSIWALAGESDVWLFKNGWVKVLDGHQATMTEGPAKYIGENDTRELNLSPDGSVLFTSNGHIWSANSTGELKLLIKKRIQGTGDAETRLVHMSAARDRAGNIWSIAHRGSNSLLLKYASTSGEPETVHTYTANFKSAYAYLATDRIGNTWLVDAGGIKQIGDNADPRSMRPWTSDEGLNWVNALALGGSGKVAYLASESRILLWTPGIGWETKEFEPLEGALSLSYDNKERLYVGTGLRILAQCGTRSSGKAQGLFRLTGKKPEKIPGAPNQWIMSIAPTRDGLAVGTSGSAMYFWKSVSN